MQWRGYICLIPNDSLLCVAHLSLWQHANLVQWGFSPLAACGPLGFSSLPGEGWSPIAIQLVNNKLLEPIPFSLALECQLQSELLKHVFIESTFYNEWLSLWVHTDRCHFFHSNFPRNIYSDLQGPYLAYRSSDFRSAYLLVNFGCPVPFSGTEASWLKAVHVRLPGRRTIYRLPVGKGPWSISRNFGESEW